MADITKCDNKNCKIKGLCWRYVASDGVWQSYSDFNNGKVIKNKKDCKYYMCGGKRMSIEDVEEVVIDD